ncbi:MAG TPA: MFS transporter [Gammaproteobacteria bacterium]
MHFSQAQHFKLYLISILALFTAGFSFALRVDISSDLQTEIFNLIDLLHSATMVGQALGFAFLGFAFTLFICSPFVDVFGMGRMLLGASASFIIGTACIVFSSQLAQGHHEYWLICVGMMFNGFGWGLTETAINPLTATLYPHDKTNKLNILHAWWPGGIMVGGLTGIAVNRLGFNWQMELSLVFIPAVVFGILCIGTQFPKTERAAAGISMQDMFLELKRRPGFFIWFGCMFLTAASELAPGQWVDMALTRTVGMQGILLLIYVSGLMFVMRHFSRPLVRVLTPVGLLWCASLLACVGLLLLSRANSALTGFMAATVWGIGVCYMWPTMLACASERYPRGGALALGLIGTAGALSIHFVLPQMGVLFDRTKIATAGGEAAFAALSGAELDQVLRVAAETSFQVVAIFPALLILIFGAIWLYDSARGGYRPQTLDATRNPLPKTK